MNTKTSPVYAFLRNPSLVDFAGHLSAVFFISGCNFRCGFCHNAGLMGMRTAGISWARLQEVCRRFSGDWVNAAVITGGEPTLCGELKGLIEFLRGQGWAVKLDTNGSRPDALRECIGLLDYVAMDVKAGLSGYAELTGFGEVDKIQKSIAVIRDYARDYEFRTTVIPAFHTAAQMREIGEMIKGSKRYVIQPFVPRDDLPDPALRETPRTDPDCLLAFQAMLAGCVEEVKVRGTLGSLGRRPVPAA